MNDRRRAAAHVFVHDIVHPVMDDVDTHHLVRVLRLRAGETVTVSNGRGAWRICTMTSSHTLEPVSDDIHAVAAAEHPIAVAFGVTKADKPEIVVQKLTEIGVDQIVPVLMEHSVVRWDEDKIDRQHERFCRVVKEAAMQSRQVYLPVVQRVVANIEALVKSSVIAQHHGALAAAEPDGDASLDGISAIVVGPEGGFSTSELEQFERRVALPGGILRAETAAIAAGVLLAHGRSHT
jgi:16S rRNA (uracil1498-N3)-methyltransferase